MPIIDFSAIAADSHQADNVGGNMAKVAIILAKNLSANWPIAANITAGEVVVAPPLVTLKTFKIIEVPQNTVRTYDKSSGDPGFQSYMQGIEFSMAGFSKEITVELLKHKNAGCVFLVENSNGTWKCVGTKLAPIFLDIEGDSGKNGGDKNGYVLKGEQTSMPFLCLPVATSVISGLTFTLPA